MFDKMLSTPVADRKTEAIILTDFTGGLRLGLPGANLAENEVRDCMNVDFPAEGGIRRRKALMPFATLVDHIDPDSDVVPYDKVGLNVYLWVKLEDGTYREISLYDNSGYVVVGLPWTPTAGGGPFTGAQLGRTMWYNDGDEWTTVKEDDVGLAVQHPMREGFREDDAGGGLPDFTTFHMAGTPRGHGALSWNSRLWVWSTDVERENGAYIWNGVDREVWTPTSGSTYETDAANMYFSFSFGAREKEGPQDFYEDWSIRFEADGYGGIVQVAPTSDRMYVFGTDSIHVVSPNYGEPVDLFYQVREYATKVGACGRHATAVDGNSVWFFDSVQGLMQINADGSLVRHMEKIEGLIGSLSPDHTSVAVEVWDGRVWVSVPENIDGSDPDFNTRTYILDLRTEAWTRYSYGVDRFYVHRHHPGHAEQFPEHLMGFLREGTNTRLCLLDYDPGPHNHDFLEPDVPLEFDSYVKTAWLTGSFNEQVKDWAGAELVFRAREGVQAQITAHMDWNVGDAGFDEVVEVASPKSFDDGRGEPLSWVVNDPVYGSSSGGSYPAYNEASVLDATLVDRWPRDGDTVVRPENYSSIVADLYEVLPEPVRLGRLCFGRSVSLTVEMVAPGSMWDLDRVAVFFERRPVRVV